MTFQALGCEKIVEFTRTRARFIKFEVLGNVGTDSYKQNYSDTTAKIGNITVFE